MTKEAKPDAWMPLYIGDYKKDTGRLSTVQHGAYLLLIMEYWSTGPLADDDEELAAITACSPRDWKRLRPKIERFFTVAEGLWRHLRIDTELAQWSARKLAAVERARKGGQARGRALRGAAASSTLEDELELSASSSPSASSAKAVTPSGVPASGARAGRAVASPARARWPGPGAFREVVVARHGEAFAVSWLDPAGWRDGVIVCRLQLAARRLAEDLRAELAQAGINIIVEREGAAA